VDLPVPPPPADRSGDRAAARWGQMTHAEPVFAPATGCRWPGQPRPAGPGRRSISAWPS